MSTINRRSTRKVLEPPIGKTSRIVSGLGFDPRQKSFLKKSRALEHASKRLAPPVGDGPKPPVAITNADDLASHNWIFAVWENSDVSDRKKAPAFNRQGELSVQCPYCQKVNIFPESENLEIFTCEFCGETVEIEESVE